jgi:P27 family predicted phage terminase small subunit
MRKTFDHSGLSAEAKRRFKEIAVEYGIQPDQTAAVLILKTAMEAFDRMREAQRAIAEHGVVFLDRYDQPRANPAAAIERDSRAAMLKCFKDLDLEISEPDPKKAPGRPSTFETLMGGKR